MQPLAAALFVIWFFSYTLYRMLRSRHGAAQVQLSAAHESAALFSVVASVFAVVAIVALLIFVFTLRAWPVTLVGLIFSVWVARLSWGALQLAQQILQGAPEQAKSLRRMDSWVSFFVHFWSGSSLLFGLFWLFSPCNGRECYLNIFFILCSLAVATFAGLAYLYTLTLRRLIGLVHRP